MKISIGLSVATLISLNLIGPPLHAQSCESAFIYQGHTNCTVPPQAAVFESARTPECGAETFKSCKFSTSVTLTGVFFGHFNEQNPGDNAATYACKAVAGNAKIRQFILDRISQYSTDVTAISDDEIDGDYQGHYGLGETGWDIVSPPKGHYKWTGLRELQPYNGSPAAKEVPSDTDSLITFEALKGRRTGERRTPNGLNGSNWWFMECDFRAVFNTNVEDRNPRCGADKYRACRDKSHGMDRAILKRFCPINGNEFSLFSSKAMRSLKVELLRGGELACATLDDMSEASSSDKAKKIAGLLGNYEVMQSAKFNMNLARSLDVGAGVFGQREADVTDAEFQVMLELARLYREVGTPDTNYAMNYAAQQFEALLPRASYGDPTLNTLVERLIEKQSNRSLKSLRLQFPSKVQILADKLRPTFAEMKAEKYVYLYPDAVKLTDEELYDAPRKIEFLKDSVAVYRLAEAAVRTGLDEIRTTQSRTLDLLDLKILTYRESTDYYAIADQLSKISGDPVAKIRAVLDAQRESADLKRTALSNIIQLQVDAANARVASKKVLLWKIVDLAGKSKDPRVPLLSGYRALSELNSSAFSQALASTAGRASDATSVLEFENSIQMLVKSARKNLVAIDALEHLGDQSDKQATAVRSSIVAQLATIAKDTDASDQLAIGLAKALETLPSGPGVEFGLNDRVQSLIEDIYRQFATALRQVPSVRE